MSIFSLELLKTVNLLDGNDKVQDLTRVPQHLLRQRLDYYCQKRTEKFNEEIENIRRLGMSNTAFLSSISASNAVLPLCPKFIVHDKLVVNDPVFKLAKPLNEFSRVEKEALGHGRDRKISIPYLLNKLYYFQILSPFIRAGILYVIPIDILHSIQGQLPIYDPENLFREQVPEGAIEFVKKSVVVNPLQNTEHGLIVVDTPNVERKRQIHISFHGDDSATSGRLEFFRELESIEKKDDNTMSVSYKPWRDVSLDQAQYDIWVEQTVNRTVGARLESIGREMHLSNILHAQYLTESEFESKLLSFNSSKKSIAELNAINFLQANADLLCIDDPDLIFRLRAENVKSFNAFQLSLVDLSNRLSGLNKEEFVTKSKILFLNEVMPIIEEINSASTRLGNSLLKGALQASGAIMLALAAGALVPIGVTVLAFGALTIGEAIPSISDLLQVRKTPQFIWHQLADE